jgi:hypothetical protein
VGEIRMRDLDWWGIGTLSLKIPFYQWRTFLASTLSALICFFLVYVSVRLLAEHVPLHRLARLLESTAFPIAQTIGLAVFEWGWLTALWHNTMRHFLTFPTHRDFWLYALIAICIGIVGQSLGVVLTVAHRFIWDEMAAFGRYISILFYIAVALVFFGILWVQLRLSIWPASIVVKRRLTNPFMIWRSTKDLAWDFFLIAAVVTIPIALLTGLALGLIYFSMPKEIATNLMLSWKAVATTYSTAVLCASQLLAYFEILGRREAMREAAIDA